MLETISDTEVSVPWSEAANFSEKICMPVIEEGGCIIQQEEFGCSVDFECSPFAS